MSDQSTFDQDPGSRTVSTPEKPMAITDCRRNIRLPLLLTVLVLLLFAVWYDYKVARSGVNEAYDIVTQLNRKHQSSANASAMTNNHVQEAVGFSPTYTITKDEYLVEAYAWTAGLPFRSHDLYAVYRGQNNKFMRHYKFVLPVEDLDPDSGGPRLDDVRRAARLPAADPYETIGPLNTDPDASAQQADSEGTAPAQTAGTEP